MRLTKEQIEERLKLIRMYGLAGAHASCGELEALCYMALQSLQQPVHSGSASAMKPEGGDSKAWVLVPREPTGGMRLAGGDHIMELRGVVTYDYLAMIVYKAMLAALEAQTPGNPEEAQAKCAVCDETGFHHCEPR